jgi:hypothetical protein
MNKRYLNDGRLHDVIAAIQVLAKWPGPSMSVKNWNDKFGEAHSADKGYDPWVRKLKERPADGDQYLPWSTIFWEHPEFFRLTEEHVSLKWRRGLEATYHPQKGRELTPDELAPLSQEERDKLRPRTLTSTEIETLINTAIELHGRDIAHEQEMRWKIQLLLPLIGGLIGSIIGAVLGGLF